MSKKILFIATIAAVAAISSCREKGPIIDFGTGRTAKDSTYTAAVETPQQHIILVEDFTGASCSNCPAAHVVLNSLETQHPGLLAILGLHILNFGQAEPWPGSKYDFRTQAATDIGSMIYGGVSAMPAAGFDRREGIGGGVINPPLDNLAISALWSNLVSTYIDTVPPVNLTVTSSLNTAGDTAFITVKAAYTKTVTTKNTLTVAITESNLVDFQEDPAAPSGPIDSNYNFTNVLRDFVSPTLGAPVLDSISLKAAGRVFTRSFLYKVNAAWKPENCKVVAFMANAESGDKHVLQAAIANLK